MGAHRVRSEGGTLFVECHGELAPDEAMFIISHMIDTHAAHGPLSVILDVRQGVSVGPATRRRLAEQSRFYPDSLGLIVIGAGLAARALVMLVNNAVRIFSGKVTPLYFCSNESEARQRDAALRAALPKG